MSMPRNYLSTNEASTATIRDRFFENYASDKDKAESYMERLSMEQMSLTELMAKVNALFEINYE